MREYQSNSHLSKEQQKAEVIPEKKVQKVVSGSVKTRENKGRKLTDIFVPGDVSTVKSHIFMDVFVPAAKDLLYKIIVDSVDMILFDGKGSRSKSGGGKISYRSYYDDKHDRRDDKTSVRSRFDYDDIVYEYRADAEAVYSQMLEILDNYQLVSVLDMYDLAGRGNEAPYTANRFGWTNLRTAEIKRVRGGFIIDLPKAMAID